jgi:uncharacterized protein (DUF2126 family)
MAIRVAIHHQTTYQYDRLVTLSPQVVRLRPAPHCRTPVPSYSLKIEPSEHFINWHQDPYGNYQARLLFPDKTRHFDVSVDLIAELTAINPFDFFLETEADNFPFRYANGLIDDLQPYLATLPAGPKLQELLAGISRHKRSTVDFLVDVNRAVHQAVKYLIRMEPGVQTAEETLRLGSGSCRDSAWLLVQTLRHLGLAARFVSGYLIQLKLDVQPLDGPPGTKEDFTDLHAWAEVYLPGAGWVGLDPTSGLLASEGHLPLAATPDPGLAAPISGAVEKCQVEFKFEMSIARINEVPRVTRPYSEEQWTAIQALGQQVDAALVAGDVRLTMGGEPTFVSIDDMDGAEWNTAALGPDKRRLAGILFRRLANRFASGPLLHFDQGKWYPGEQLPRWALGCYWRKDGQPIWQRPQLIAEDDRDYGANAATAKSFVAALARRLGVASEHAVPGHEDAWYYLARERRLPVNVDPLKSNLKDVEERNRLARIFEQGLENVVGYALPLRSAEGPQESAWVSGPWFFRGGHMWLVPGDSPMGYRLPLDSLPWIAKEDEASAAQYDRDPFVPRGPLPEFARAPVENNGQLRYVASAHAPAAQTQTFMQPGVALLEEPAGCHAHACVSMPTTSVGMAPDPIAPWPDAYPAAATMAQPRLGQSAKGLVRTALCVESRGGRLYVFMPPVPELENYLALVAAVEETAAEMALPVTIEGYPPPHDPRVQHFKVTPDPGVIEVNLQPAGHWEELVDFTSTLYEEARLSRLGTEKFMLDGRHTGTGGGNHIVLGGATPADSPFLRRPDLLRSLLAYWNNRPALSYLFSGLFIGPTSQAPRVDEARHESLYELEIAFRQLPETGTCPPWLVDRVFRHLLVDVTGNTHRAEFCIDKLFSPDTATGRLGLVEFRSFEMPPHARMSLTQQLLMRALVARFWNEPYRQPLVRWGTSLHDRFMLPHFVAQDFAEVIDDLRRGGFAFQQDWFTTHFEFRFPLVGRVAYCGVELELRQAIEPWHVLGEEAGAGGTARYVDSSVERLQVKVRGLTDPRYVVICNGRRVPLHPTGERGEFVAGVRYRAWQPPSCLHPTIGVHAPLVFDLYDQWSQRSMGGCTWHVAHPGGRHFETFPVNDAEAESRRIARFFAIGHTGGQQAVPPSEPNRDYPFTLDLRRSFTAGALDD